MRNLKTRYCFGFVHSHCRQEQRAGDSAEWHSIDQAPIWLEGCLRDAGTSRLHHYPSMGKRTEEETDQDPHMRSV